MTPKDLRHVLIIGGTGMLSEVVNHYSNIINNLTLVARNEQRLQNLKSHAQDPGKVHVLSLDYTQTEAAISTVEKTLKKSVPVDAAILWIHSTGKNFKIKLYELLIKLNSRVKIYELLGSTNLRSIDLSALQEQPKDPNVRKIILGCIKENNGTRWLTDAEIYHGTLAAIQGDKPLHVIGELPD